jgi:hypothetical protein
MSKMTPHREALQELKKLEANFDKILAKIDEYRSYEATLNCTAAEVPQIEQFQLRFKKRQTIWNNWDTFTSHKKTWYLNNFREQDAEAIVKTVNKFAKENMDMKMRMNKEDTDEVLEELTKDVNEVSGHKNLLLALGSKAML